MSETTTTRRSLATAFAPAPPVGRSARLMEALPPRPQLDQLDQLDPSAPAVAPPRSPSPPPDTYPDHPSTADDVVRSVAVYLPPPLLARLRHAARTEELTYADVLVRAAGNHIDTIATRFSPPPPTPVNPGMPARNRPCRPTPGIQTQLRLDGHQIAWLAEAAQRVRAPSRTALVVALLDAELP